MDQKLIYTGNEDSYTEDWTQEHWIFFEGDSVLELVSVSLYWDLRAPCITYF